MQPFFLGDYGLEVIIMIMMGINIDRWDRIQ
jgi:hypothetical protein